MSWYPGWDSLDSVKIWHVGLEIAGIAVLALLVITEILAFQYGHRKDFLIEIAERDRITEQQRVDNERKIEVEGLQTQLSEAGKKVIALQNQTVARQFNAEQRAAIITALSPFAGQKAVFECLNSAWDCIGFAEDFSAVLKQSQWDVSDYIAMSLGGDVIGVQVLVNPQMANAGQVSIPAVIPLINNLVSFGFMAQGPNLGRVPGIALGTIHIRIGRIVPPPAIP